MLLNYDILCCIELTQFNFYGLVAAVAAPWQRPVAVCPDLTKQHWVLVIQIMGGKRNSADHRKIEKRGKFKRRISPIGKSGICLQLLPSVFIISTDGKKLVPS